MKNDEKLVIKRTEKMWKWLAANPNARKVDYFIEEGIKKVPLHECYCCEYVGKKFKIGLYGMLCSQIEDVKKYEIEENINLAQEMLNACPLKELWPKGCIAKGSAFKNWCADIILPIERSKHALKIANFCQKLLDKAAKSNKK